MESTEFKSLVMTEIAKFHLKNNTTLMETPTWMNGGIYWESEDIIHTLHSDFKSIEKIEKIVKQF